MKSCLMCVKKDVCKHRPNIMTNFGYIVEARFGSIYSEMQEFKDILEVVGKHCSFYLYKGDK